MDTALRRLLSARLEASDLDPEVRALVLASFDGDDALDRVLDGLAAEVTDEVDLRPAGREVWLASLTVEGFRGVADALTVPLDPQPGLTVFAGRNGSGKSTLAEALDALLTGTSHRWHERAADVREGWRNLHHTGARRVAASFLVSGRDKAVEVERSWASDDVSRSVVRVDDEPATTLGPLGNVEDATAWRPVLSCGQMARTVDGDRSVLFDAIAKVLGLEAVTAATKGLQRAIRARTDARKHAAAQLEGLQRRLEGVEEPRAIRCATLLAAKVPDRAALEVLATEGAPTSDDDLQELRALAAVQLPDPAKVEQAVDDLRRAAAEVARLSDSQAGHGERLAALLSAALDARPPDGACPVCHTPDVLDAAWVEQAKQRVDQAKADASALRAARHALPAAERALRSLVTSRQPPSDRVREAGERWRRLEGVSLADDVAATWEAIAADAAVHIARAQAALAARQAAWRPIARALAAWLQAQASADVATAQSKQLRAAKKWLVEAEGDLRDERFAPLSEEALRIWGVLRQESHVTLEQVSLAGRANRRHLALQVTVDGASTEARGVMSQGELNALALALFVPRTTLPESPFRFVVIDDPVQAMDPHKVDGLAQALAELAKVRQTVVLTHDERLLESLRRQRIPATVHAVTRTARSKVQVTRQLDPVAQHLEDARKVLSAGSLDARVVQRVVPGFCREALEACFVRRIRRVRLRRGEAHADVESLVHRRGTLRSLASLALFDDHRRGEEVEEALDALLRDAGTLFGELNRGTHAGTSWVPKKLVKQTGKLTKRLEAL